MIIPIQELERDTLTAIIEAYVLREGTDYGEDEVSMEQKIEDVRQLLIRGDALLVYSELHESVNILSQEEAAARAENGAEFDSAPE